MFARLLRFIFGPHTFEIVAFFLAATGVSFALSADGEDVVKAHWFFGAAFLLSLGRVAHLVLTWREASSVRYVLSFFLFGAIGLGWVLTYDWVQKKADKLAIARTSESPSSSPTETPKTNANASPP